MRLFVIAGEPSGDALGGALLAGLHMRCADLALSGVGGQQMEAQGLTSLFPMQELSLMGLVEILPKYRHLKRRIRETAEAVIAAAPDALITIDSPDFCLRVARLVKAALPGLKVIHYVAPSVWAWRAGRAEKMAKVVDHVLALLPFEPPYMEAAGMGCDFVGHPVAARPVPSAAQIAAFRAGLDLGAGQSLLAVLPGSRRGEISRLAQPFGQTLAQLGDARAVVPTLPHLVPLLRQLTSDWPRPPEFVTDPDQRFLAMAASDAALAASGTVSLELAAAGTPMVIAYDMNWLTMRIVRRMMSIDTVTLVNLVSDTRAVPEFLGNDCRAELIAPALQAILAGDAGGQGTAMDLTMERLGRGQLPPGERAAEAVLKVLASDRR